MDSFIFSPASAQEKDPLIPDTIHSLETLVFTNTILDKEKKRIVFECETSVPDDGGKLRPVKFTKTYQFSVDGLEVTYDITNLQEKEFSFRFATSFNFNFFSDADNKLTVNYISRGKERILEEKQGLCRDVKSVNLRDGHLKTNLDLESSKNFEMNMSRLIIDDTLSEEPSYQGTGMNISWRKRVGPLKTWSVSLNLKLQRQDGKKNAAKG